MDVNRTSLSAGLVIRPLLSEDKWVKSITSHVFPVVTDTATLPYILYRRSSLEHDPVKTGTPGADSIQVEVACFARTYTQSVDLAEATRHALEYTRGEGYGIKMRSCKIADAEESWQDDAFVQQLVFTIKI